jgi:hypothetical protein
MTASAGCSGSQGLATIPTPIGATATPHSVTSGTPVATPTPSPQAPTTPPPAAPSSWTLVPSPDPPFGAGSQLNAVTCVSAADCWAVGFAGGASGASVTTGTTLIEQDAGSGWAIVSSPDPSGAEGSTLQAVTCAGAGDCWAVGYSTDSNLNASTLIEQDTGSGWTIVPSPTPSGGGELLGVGCAGADECWAVGYATDPSFNSYALIEEDSASGWAVVPTPTPSGEPSGQLNAVSCASASDCWAVGYASTVGGTPLTLIEQDTGSGWKLISSPNAPGAGEPSALDGVSCATPDSCWAVGTSGASNAWYALIEEDTGSGWTIVPSPTVSVGSGGWLDALAAVSCASGGDCWGAGLLESGLTLSGAADEFTLIEAYAGGGWLMVSSPNPPDATGIALSGVSCVSGGDCWAVGSYQDGNGNLQSLIEQSTGSG